MKFISRRDDAQAFGANICVIGAGPVGLATAIRCARNGAKVLVLEAGSRTPAPAPDAIIIGTTHAPMALAACGAFGGTSWLWGGRCTPLDPSDFAEWPIREMDVAPYYAFAAELLGCGEAVFAGDRKSVV